MKHEASDGWTVVVVENPHNGVGRCFAYNSQTRWKGKSFWYCSDEGPLSFRNAHWLAEQQATDDVSLSPLGGG